MLKKTALFLKDGFPDMVVSCPVYLWGEPGVDNHVLEGEQDVGGVVRTSLALPESQNDQLNMLRVRRRHL